MKKYCEGKMKNTLKRELKEFEIVKRLTEWCGVLLLFVFIYIIYN